MTSRNVGAAPLLAGLVLAGHAAAGIARQGPSAWLAVSLVGGLAAAIVGGSTLLGRSDVRPAARPSRTRTAAVVGLAALSSAAGAALALA